MSFLAVLFVGIGFWSCAASRTPNSESAPKKEKAAPSGSMIPVWGAIAHLHESDNKSYTVTVTSGKRSGSATDTQSTLKKIPLPDIRTFSPAAGETISAKPPHFSWQAVDADVPLYYRLEIKDMQDNYVFRTDYVKDMFAVHAPSNLLKAGQTYGWRVRVADGTHWIELNNRSQNQWQQITVAQTLSEAGYTYRVPIELNDGWQTSSLTEAGLDAEKINELMHRILIGDDSVKNIHSVLLVKDGRLVLEEYFYGTHRNHLHPIQSDTKSVVSILIGIAVDKGFIKTIDQTILDFFPEIAPANIDADKRAITIEHLLMMAPGLQCRDSYRFKWRGLSEMRQSADWTRFMLDLPMAEAPGTRFEYCNGASFLLSAIIQKGTGMKTLEFAEKHLFSHLGITELRWPANPQGITIGWGDMRLKPRDMAKIGYLMLKGGHWQGQQIVSRNWVKKSTRPHIKAGGYEYGYQWWRGQTIVNNRVIDAFWAWGHGGQYILVIPALDLVVVLTAKHRENPGYSERAFNMLTRYIIPAVTPSRPPGTTVAVKPKVLEAYVGTYTFKHDKGTETVNIILKANKLYGSGDDGEIVELYPETENRFYGTSKYMGGIKLQFVKNQKGDVANMIAHVAPQFAFMRIPFGKIE